MKQLRSDAFWQLHRSVAENGEGLVRRMRDYEHSRSRAETYSKVKDAQKRGLKRSSLNVPARKSSLTDESDEDDDIQIFSGDVPDIFFPRSLRPQKRALSLDIMDEAPERFDLRSHSIPGNERCSSPGASSSSMYASDDEQQSHILSPTSASFSSTPSYTPALSHTASESSNSSLVSLPLSPPMSIFPSHAPLMIPHTPSSPPSSRSEKALAAISLAMANGAGSIHDYASLSSLHQNPLLDNCDVGEMWH